ncbi:hypothetical protein Caci_8393 [Catenulispora acidiphila DSM 44928]|uniref:Uncharacterized protein n=1 Tax=Catenulispora acidiphila (strain DSM 44928 / JCM 14897 / NBRC 102108 / NRRL B-24433 / ID139908) TaxID=479433 RepID=C7PWV9_CATAD|nr:hypothetical protein [Catenulispora acidiphila]ACU77216.1 hypothetical protein Caci_8393 [Catenulispora acidiphila DSM 44928]
MSADDIRQTAKVGFRKDLNWVSLPNSFPFGKWGDSREWVENMAAMVYYVGRSQFDGSRPTPEWFIRTCGVIDASWRGFASVKNRYKCLLFHDVDALPAHVAVDAYLGDLPWAEARDIYVGAHHDEVVEGLRVEAFEMAGAEAAVRAVYFTVGDLETRSLVASYNYAFRADGMDVLVRSTFPDLGLVRDALPVLDEFVRGITLSFGGDAGAGAGADAGA